MFITFYCGNCGKQLDWWNESHDSGEFLFDKTNLDCTCGNPNNLIKISYHRG